jgi:hypothetical protein
MPLENLSLDLQAFIRTAAALALLFSLYSAWQGIRFLRSSGDLPYFRLRQKRAVNAWRLIGLSIILLIVAGGLAFSGEDIAYNIFQVTATSSPEPTASLTPSLTLSPTITLTPSETPTLQFTYTPSATAIPQLPLSIEALFLSSVTPDSNAVFSPLTFSTGLNLSTYDPSGVATEFQIPIPEIFASFSYDQMQNGVQWTALWYRQGDLVHFETLTWDGGTGGLGFTEWSPDAEEWIPGIYQVQIFVGSEPQVVGEFEVVGDQVTSTATVTPSLTPTPVPTNTPLPTFTVTHTRFPTDTPIDTPTRTPIPSPTEEE